MCCIYKINFVNRRNYFCLLMHNLCLLLSGSKGCGSSHTNSRHFQCVHVQVNLTILQVYGKVCMWRKHNTRVYIYNHILQTADGSVNQIPPWTEVQGDIRLTPFYDVGECVKKVEGYVAELNKGIQPCFVPTFFLIVHYVHTCVSCDKVKHK